MKFGVLQITGADGRQRELPLELPSLVVGRAEGTGILIDDLSISRRHARLVIDSGRLMVEDLGSAQGTFIDGERIPPGTANLVDQASELRFGDIVVRFVPPPPAELPGAGIDDQEQDRERDLSTASRLGVTLTPPNQPVYAGAPWIASVRVHNRSSVVDRVLLSVPDLPEEWVKIDRPALALPPGASETVELKVMPPRRSEALAGDYDFTVLVTSTEHQREATALGQFTLHPFQNLALSLEAPRAKRNFVVVAENKGNEVQTYTLSGEDPDAAWGFEFELPSVTLQPGERRTVGLRVNRKRQLMGIATPLPFNVHAESDAAEPEKVTAIGQLAVNPPLQKFRGVAMFVVAAVVIAGVAIALMLVRDGEVVTKANAESPYAGVHLCDKDAKAQADARAKQEAAAAQSPGGGTPLTTGSNSGAPFFAQNDPRWGKDEYARAKDPEFGPDWCGSTIEQCGCAMTSVATTMALFGLLTMPDGTALTPQALNNWFNAEATKTNRGWVSRGYIYGDVIWTAANQLSGEMAAKNPGAPTIRFSRTGNGSDDEIKEQLKQGRPIILEVPGHWIAAVGLDGDTIQINDPFYRDRKTLDVYKGKVKSSVIFEPSSDLSAVVFTAPADVRVRITDKQGRVVGTLATGSAEDAEKTATNEIPGASYSSRQAWRDPSCIESAPPSDAGTNQIILPGGANDYKVEVLDAAGKPTSIAIHTYDKQGKSSVQTIDNPGSAVAQVSVGGDGGQTDVKVIAGGKPTPEPTPAGGGGGGPDQTVGPAATATRPPAPTPTPEPIVETGLAISAAPGDTFVAIQSQEGFAIGDTIIFSPGKANEEENRIIGFGSFILEFPLRYAHSPGEVIRKKPRPPGSSPATDRPLPPAPVLPPLVAPENLTLGCSAVYVADPKEATMICTLDIAGTFTTTRWSVNGKAVDDVNNQQLLLMAFNTDGNAAVGVSVCNRTICKSTSFQQKIQFPAPGTTGGTTGGTGGTGGTGAALPTQTPPPTGIVVNCTSQFEQGAQPKAVVTCAALFSGPSTSISWSAPGGRPASGQGKTFTTDVLPNTVTKLRVTATVCNFAVCQTSPTVDVGIGGSTTRAFLRAPQVPVGSTTTFTAIVTGAQPPSGGTIQFRDALAADTIRADDRPIGPSVPIFTAGALGFAQVTITTGTSPLLDPNTNHHIYAIYSGGTNLFGSTSTTVPLLLVDPIEELCNAKDDNDDGAGPGGTDTIDDGCDLTMPRDIGGGTIISELQVAANLVGEGVATHAPNDIVVRPNATLAVNSKAVRTEFCPGCLRQVYIGFGANEVNGSPALGPACVFSGGLGAVLPGVSLNTWKPNAPKVPGIYYLRASNTLDFSCVNAPIGPVDMNLGRVVVQTPTQTTMTFWTTAATPSQATAVNPGDTVDVRIQVLGTADTGAARPAGRVLLYDGPNPVAGSLTALDATGLAVVRFTVPNSGAHLLRAAYLGYPESGLGEQYDDQFYLPSEQTLSTALVSLTVPTTAKIGDTVNATVAVTTGGGTTSPAGATLVLRNGSGTQIPTTPPAPIVAADGSASFSFVAGAVGIAAPGDFDLHATFSGTSTVLPSDSPSQPVAITKGVSSTAVVLAPATSIVVGEDLTMTATITGVPFGSPDGGIVTFRVGPAANDIIGTATVSAPPLALGVAILTFKTGPTPIALGGPYNIYAEFGGTTNLNNSTSPSQSITVLKSPAVVTTPAFSANPTTVGAAGTITVTISPPAGKTPGGVTGLADFYNGPSLLPDRSNLLPGGGNIAVVPVGGSSDNATATYSLALLNAGSYTVGVHYQGSGKYEAGDSATAALTVNKADTTIATTVTTPGPIAIGDTITLRATVPATGGPVTGVLNPDPGGTVQFMAGTNAIGAPQTVSGGIATLNWTTGGVGGFPLDTAATYLDIHSVYSGNANLNSKTSSDIALTLTKRTPAVGVSVTPPTQVIGGTVDFRATVDAGAIIPDGGTVQFRAGANPIGSPVTVSGGEANLNGVVTGTFPFDTGATYSDIHADYDGNNNVAAASSVTPTTLVLNKAAASAWLAAISPVTLGNPGTFVATVTTLSVFSVQGPAGGATVQFYKDGSTLGSPVLVAANGTATFTAPTGDGTAFVDSGTFVIHAVYNGTSQLQSAKTGNQSFVVDKAPSIVALTITGAPFTVGGSGSLRAVVSPGPGGGPGAITGSVNFTAVLNGSAVPLASNVAVTSIAGPGQDVEAIMQIAGLNAGSYTNVVASYSGSSKYAPGSSSPAQTFTINKVTPGVTLATPGTHTIGTSITLSATVDGPSAGVLSPVGGTVTFKAGANTITTATVAWNGTAAVASATVTTGTSPLDTGDFDYTDITATFVDDGPNLNTVTSANGTLRLNKATASVSLNDIGNVAFGASATYTATVTAPGTSAIVQPGGATVTFSVDGTTIGTSVIGGAADAGCGGGTASAGTAVCVVTPGAAPLAMDKGYTMTATYNGSSQVSTGIAGGAGSASDPFTVTKAIPTVTVTNDGPVTVGSSVTITAAVSATGVATNGGTVTFTAVDKNSANPGTIGTAVVGGAASPGCGGGTSPSGQAVCIAATGSAPLTSGGGSPYTVTAAFATTAQVAAGSGTTSVTVNKTGPTVSFTSGTGSSALGSTVSFVVNVTGSCSGGNTSSCPTGGHVSLYIGTNTSGTLVERVTVNTNTATFTPIVTGTSPFANAGNYSMYARFEGDATNGNVSVADTTGTLTLTAVTPTVTITSSAATGSTSDTFTLTATITPNYSPTGTVQFKDGATDIGTLQTLSAGNSVQITGITFAATGAHVITAAFTNTSANYTGPPIYVTVTITIS